MFDVTAAATKCFCVIIMINCEGIYILLQIRRGVLKEVQELLRETMVPNRSGPVPVVMFGCLQCLPRIRLSSLFDVTAAATKVYP